MKRDNLGRFIKGYHYGLNTEFKKGQRPYNWKGGRRKLKNGYIWCYASNHPRAYRNGIYEHILIAEKKIGRHLFPNEVIHHLNGIKYDNREENIIVCQSDKEHFKNHRLKTWSKKYNQCRRCGTTQKKYGGKGLCENCYKYCQYHKKLCEY